MCRLPQDHFSVPGIWESTGRAGMLPGDLPVRSFMAEELPRQRKVKRNRLFLLGFFVRRGKAEICGFVWIMAVSLIK